MDHCQRCPDGTTTGVTDGARGLGDCVPVVDPPVRRLASECDAGSYWNGLHTCIACPTGSTSPAGSDNPEACECEAGRYWDGTACTQCGQHTFSESTPTAFGELNNVCVNCPTNAYIWTLGGSSAADCKCGPGAFWTGALCVPCMSGWYSAGGYSAVGGFSFTCQQCPTGSTTEMEYSRKAEDCKCKAGLYWNAVDDACVQCGEYLLDVLSSGLRRQRR